MSRAWNKAWQEQGASMARAWHGTRRSKMKLWLIKKLAEGNEYEAIREIARGQEKDIILKLVAEHLEGHHVSRNPVRKKRPKLVGDSSFVGAWRAVE
jgi:hypothetical protein